MAEEKRPESTNLPQKKTRRTVVKTAAQVAVTAPAVAMLLAAGTKPASATVVYSAPGDQDTGTVDRTSGPANNTHDYDYGGGAPGY